MQKRFRFSLVLAGFCSLFFLMTNLLLAQDVLPLTPYPNRVQIGNDKFTLPSTLSFFIEGEAKESLSLSQLLQQDFKQAWNIDVKSTSRSTEALLHITLKGNK